MEAQHMTQQVFADFIGLSPATVSGIFTGRTNPTLNIVEAIKKKIPDINTDWLMFGQGSMFQSSDSGEPVPSSTPVTGQESMLDFSPYPVSSSRGATPQSSYSNGVRSTHPETVREEIKFIDKPQRKVTEIRVYYDDQTWESFVPSKK
jgi:transcriptional regulator with XRE-family HTH domain